LAGDRVRVDDHRAARREERGDGRLAGTDPAGESDEQHGGAAYGTAAPRVPYPRRTWPRAPTSTPLTRPRAWPPLVASRRAPAGGSSATRRTGRRSPPAPSTPGCSS